MTELKSWPLPGNCWLAYLFTKVQFRIAFMRPPSVRVAGVGLYTVCGKKVSSKVVCHFLSNHLEFLSEILHVYYLFITCSYPVYAHKMPSGIWLPSITVQKMDRKDYTKINKWEILLSWWRQSEANFVNNKCDWFIHQQFLDTFDKAFIVDATTVS